MKRRGKKELKDAQPKYRLIMMDTKAGKEILDIMRDMTNRHHEELRNATIAPAWMIRNKTDRDGILVLGKMKKATELERLAHGNDAFLLLNQEAWERFDDRQKRALIDHELEHLTVSLDEGTGEPKLDGHGKTRYRIRKHDVEEFQAIISRHGCHKNHLRQFAEEALRVDNQLKLWLGTVPPAKTAKPEAAKVH